MEKLELIKRQIMSLTADELAAFRLRFAALDADFRDKQVATAAAAVLDAPVDVPSLAPD